MPTTFVAAVGLVAMLAAAANTPIAAAVMGGAEGMIRERPFCPDSREVYERLRAR